MVAAVSLGERRGTGVDFETGREGAELRSFWCDFESTIGFHAFDPRSSASPEEDLSELTLSDRRVRQRRCTACWIEAARAHAKPGELWALRRAKRAGCRECCGTGTFEPNVNFGATASPGSSVDANDPYAARLGQITRGNRVWRALRVLDVARDARSLVILHRLYGDVLVPEAVRRGLSDDPKRWSPSSAASEAACLVTLTDAAEEARDEMACTRGIERESSVRLKCVRNVDDATETFWRMAPRWEKLAREWETLREEHGTLREGRDDLRITVIERRMGRLATERAGLRKTLDEAMRAEEIDPMRPVLAAMETEDHAATVSEAVALRLLDSSTERRSKFVSDARRQARQLRTAAHLAYRAAKAEVSAS